MLKIAKRLIALVIVMILGVLVFIWYRSSQPPALLGLIPKDIQKAGFIDVRNVLKKAYSAGATDLHELPYPAVLMDLFSFVENPKEPGINLFSELVWFQHNEGYSCLFVRLANVDKWSDFLTQHRDKIHCQAIEQTDDISYTRLQNYNAVLAWRGKHLALLFDDTSAEQLSYSQAKQVLKPDAYNSILDRVYEKTAPDLVYYDLKKNQSLAMKLLPGKVRYEWNEYLQAQKTFKPFSNVMLNENKVSDTSVILLSAHFLKQPVNAAFLPSINLRDKLNSLGFYYPTHSASARTQIVPYTNKPEILSDYKIEEKGFLFLFDLKELNTQAEQIVPIIRKVSEFQRFVMIANQTNQTKQVIGTCYFSAKDKLPFREVTKFILESSLLKN